MNLNEKLAQLESIDREHHLEALHEIETKFRSTLNKEQEYMLNGLLTLVAAEEKWAGKIILLKELREEE